MNNDLRPNPSIYLILNCKHYVGRTASAGVFVLRGVNALSVALVQQ